MGPLRFLPHSRLQRDTFLLLALQVFYKLSGLILLVVLSRNLPAEDIGLYFFALSFAGSFVVLANLQINAVRMRRVAADSAHAPAHLAALLGFRLVGSPVYLLCVSAAALALTKGIWRGVPIVALLSGLVRIFFFFGHRS